VGEVARSVLVQRNGYRIEVSGDSEAPIPDIEIERGGLGYEPSGYASGGSGLTSELSGVKWGTDIEDGASLVGDVAFRLAGLPGSAADVTGVHLTHLQVRSEYEGEGVGTFLFDIYTATARYVDGDASGRIGARGNADEFLVARGVPRSSITEKSGALSAAQRVYVWSTTSPQLWHAIPTDARSVR